MTTDQSEVCTEMISDKGWLQILSTQFAKPAIVLHTLLAFFMWRDFV